MNLKLFVDKTKVTGFMDTKILFYGRVKPGVSKKMSDKLVKVCYYGVTYFLHNTLI